MKHEARVKHPRAVPRNLRFGALTLSIVGGAQHPLVLILLSVGGKGQHAVGQPRKDKRSHPNLSPHDRVVTAQILTGIRVQHRNNGETGNHSPPPEHGDKMR